MHGVMASAMSRPLPCDDVFLNGSYIDVQDNKPDAQKWNSTRSSATAEKTARQLRTSFCARSMIVHFT